MIMSFLHLDLKFTQKITLNVFYSKSANLALTKTDFFSKIPRHVGSYRHPYNFVEKSVQTCRNFDPKCEDGCLLK